MSSLGVLADHLLVCQSLSHHHIPMLAMALDKEDYFVCLLVVTLFSATVRVLSLSLFLSLIACASFKWYVIPAKHFPQKSLSRNPIIGFPLSPLPNHALLPLTHDLTTSYIGWVQGGDVWALCICQFHIHPKFVYCSHVRRGPEACLLILPPILNFLWCEPFSGFSFFKACSFRG